MVLRDKYLGTQYDVGDVVDDVSNNITGIIIRCQIMLFELRTQI